MKRSLLRAAVTERVTLGMPVMVENENSRAGNKEVEYSQTIAYIHHMYETRHKAFHFTLVINAGLVAITFNGSGPSFLGTLALAGIGFLATLALFLFGKRNSLATNRFEKEAMRIEKELGFSLVTSTHAKALGGIHSGYYLNFVYLACIVFWAASFVFFLYQGDLSQV